MSGKHVPQRTCAVCRQKRDKRLLTRVVGTATGIQIDRSGKMSGRGAYLCEQADCWERAIHSPVLGNALRVTLTNEDHARLQQAKP
jgi:hypothetical protein